MTSIAKGQQGTTWGGTRGRWRSRAARGADLGLKGERALARKTSLERRGAQWPGQHGHARRRKASVYSERLARGAEAQDLLRRPGGPVPPLLRPPRADLDRRRGGLLGFLEAGLDAVVSGSTSGAARSPAVRRPRPLPTWTAAGPICSRRVRGRPRRGAARERTGRAVRPGRDGAGATRVPDWLEADHDAVAGRVLRAPMRREILVPVAEQLRRTTATRDGHRSSTGECFDIGRATRLALSASASTGEPYPGDAASTPPATAR